MAAADEPLEGCYLSSYYGRHQYDVAQLAHLESKLRLHRPHLWPCFRSIRRVVLRCSAYCCVGSSKRYLRQKGIWFL